MWTEDVSQTYLESASELLREVYLRPNRQLHVPAGYVLKLLRPLYGLADSGDYWHLTFSKHLTDDLRMKAAASDLSLFFRRAKGKISGLLASYVDDTLAYGDNSFAKLTKKTREKFEMKASQNKDMRFSGVYVDKCDNGLEIHQRAYI